MRSTNERPDSPQVVNFHHKLNLLTEHWQPRIVAEMNNYQFKIVKILGDFVMHTHADTDEAFIVLEGQLRIDFLEGHVVVNAGEMYVVPAGTAHKTRAESEVRMLMIEPEGVTNTGDEGGERTAPNDVWI
ncbi:cupin domain-containing protein [Erwinia mallotivora]|uniref:Cupin n=1 Tax=Erwinia mallotivora TaxID=69222 RepID=A0A014M6C9_9GAMM|nr:cupin domain-containing protein [Erwinia mallotivora]EXU77341.1 cupin [Erwinia mallotivora]